MSTTQTTLAANVQIAALVHQDILDRFIAIVEAKLETAENAFVEESLAEMLGDLYRQRHAHMVATPAVELPLAA